MSELREGMASIIDAFRPVLRITEGSGRKSHVGTAFVVGNEHRRFAITAEHVLDGLEDKLLGIDETGSVRWPRKYATLTSIAEGLPKADVAWATLERPVDTAMAGAAIPFALASSAITITPGVNYLAVGQPASKARMVDGHSSLSSKIMMAFVEPATEDVRVALGIDERVQLAFTYPRDSRERISRGEFVPAKPHGMSGGAMVVTGRIQRAGAPARMIPFVVGVLTRYYVEHFTFVATRIEHIWATIGHGIFASQPLYDRTIVSYRAGSSSSNDHDV